MNQTLWIEVDLSKLARNVKTVRKLTGPQVKIMGIIKQNAYGHGFIPIAKKLERQKIDFLGINNQQEAWELIESKIKVPSLILSNIIKPKKIDLLIKKKIRFTLMELSLARHLNRAARKNNQKALIHIKIDTGMGRLGIRHTQAESFIEKIHIFKNLTIEGIYSHFSWAEKDFNYTNSQILRFSTLLNNLKVKKIKPHLAHICNSAGLINFKKSHFDLVRTGLILYGIKPDAGIKVNVEPVLKLKARLIYIKKIPKNSYVSYSNTYKTKQDTLIGIIPCGYAYGYPWSLSGKAKALIKEKLCRILGRICMDHMVIDLNPIKKNVNIGDEVTLIDDKDNNLSASFLAKEAGTISYEILSRLSERIPRVYSLP